MTFSLVDYKTLLRRHPDSPAFLDPPYDVETTYYSLEKRPETFDHRALAQTLRRRQTPWLATYGDTKLIRRLYQLCTIAPLRPARYGYEANGQIMITPDDEEEDDEEDQEEEDEKENNNPGVHVGDIFATRDALLNRGNALNKNGVVVNTATPRGGHYVYLTCPSNKTRNKDERCKWRIVARQQDGSTFAVTKVELRHKDGQCKDATHHGKKHFVERGPANGRSLKKRKYTVPEEKKDKDKSLLHKTGLQFIRLPLPPDGLVDRLYAIMEEQQGVLNRLIDGKRYSLRNLLDYVNADDAVYLRGVLKRIKTTLDLGQGYLECKEVYALMSDAGCKTQTFHTDWCVGSSCLPRAPPFPGTVIVALEDNTRLHVVPGHQFPLDSPKQSDVQTLKIKPGQGLFVAAHTVHAGAAYRRKNIRLCIMMEHSHVAEFQHDHDVLSLYRHLKAPRGRSPKY